MAAKKMKRRDFLGSVGRGAALGAFGFGAFSLETLSARGAPRVAANDRISFGLIGCGDLGCNHHLSRIVERPEFDVVAVCDVDETHVDQAVAITGGAARKYRDFRALLDRNDIDAVMIVTPDHWHALAAIHACQAGKDVYCEKPLSLTVAEGRAMVNAVRRYGRIFQTGSQQRSDFNFWWACDLVQNGCLGKIGTVTASIGEGPTCPWEPDQDPPPHLDWDFWLGPAPYRPYTPQRCHYNFRWFYDTSGGKMTDWGAHHLDIAQWGLGYELSGPAEVEGTAVHPSSGLYETAITFDVTYTYPDGTLLRCTSAGENGVTFEGSEGRLFVSRSRIEADPPEILDTPPGCGAVRLYESRDHLTNWVDCLFDRRLPICDVEIGHRSATVCHLGNIAIQLGRKLRWDPVTERFVGDEQANRFLGRPMRQPWSL
ncbi:MAG: Gfo/Idh/MocA family oxidoreductase [Planctomycetota bacterium]